VVEIIGAEEWRTKRFFELLGLYLDAVWARGYALFAV
jgi:hypothetical protein